MPTRFDARNLRFIQIINASDAIYKIPRYQRAYAWDLENARDFWTDLKSDSPGASLFAGSFVFNYEWVERGEPIEVIDGQQRLVTATLYAAAVRDHFYSLGFTSDAELVQREMIGVADRRTGAYTFRVIAGDSSRAYLEEYIQHFPKNDFPDNQSREHKLIVDNYNLFHSEMTRIIRRLELDEAKSMLHDIYDYLRNMRVIRIQVWDSSEAYTIFETVNARGAELTLADLIKNTVFSQVREDQHRDIARDKWDMIFDQLGGEIDFTKFVRYHWLSRYSFETKKKLFKRMKRTIDNWDEYLDQLVSTSAIMGALTNESVEGLDLFHPRHVLNVNRSLQVINMIGANQSYVMLLTLFDNWGEIGFSKPHRILDLLAKFTFYYHGVCKLPANRVERLFSRKARELVEISIEENARTRNGMRNRWLSDLRSSLEDLKYPGLFVENFPLLVYKNSPKSRKMIKYVLRQINTQLSPEGFEEGRVSIEHILPQNPREWDLTKSDVKDYVNTIGNLTLVGVDYNSEMGNKILSEKLPSLRQSEIALTRKLVSKFDDMSELIWDEETIWDRTNELGEISLELWDY